MSTPRILASTRFRNWKVKSWFGALVTSIRPEYSLQKSPASNQIRSPGLAVAPTSPAQADSPRSSGFGTTRKPKTTVEVNCSETLGAR